MEELILYAISLGLSEDAARAASREELKAFVFSDAYGGKTNIARFTDPVPLTIPDGPVTNWEQQFKGLQAQFPDMASLEAYFETKADENLRNSNCERQDLRPLLRDD